MVFDDHSSLKTIGLPQLMDFAQLSLKEEFAQKHFWILFTDLKLIGDSKLSLIVIGWRPVQGVACGWDRLQLQPPQPQ